MRRPALASSSVCLALALACGAPSAALADADPPSDFLPGHDAYLPYSGSQAASARRLTGLLSAARKRGQPFKVAVIASASDLGGIPALFGEPGRYSTFLAGEIRPFLPPRRATLVVVMPQGVGLFGAEASASARAAVRRLGRPGGTDLAAVAVRAVRTVAAANGRPLPRVVEPAPSGGGTTGRWLLVAALLLALGGGCALALRARAEAAGTPSG